MVVKFKTIQGHSQKPGQEGGGKGEHCPQRFGYNLFDGGLCLTRGVAGILRVARGALIVFRGIAMMYPKSVGEVLFQAQ